ncbi:M48 family metallopeptidase [Streptomyces bauhiniae]|uniref:M48 family metallopeptidase n=1 Tax=Streptomyces bauhiniae TaxID=2340725 RepID=UPI0036502B43
MSVGVAVLGWEIFNHGTYSNDISVLAITLLAFGVWIVTNAVICSLVVEPPLRRNSIELTPDAVPVLWSTIECISRHMCTEPPERVRLVPEVEASVTARLRFLGLSGSSSTLYVGLPLLLLLEEDEITALLCHELGHRAGGHPRFGAVTAQGVDALKGVVESLTQLAKNDRIEVAFPNCLVLRFFQKFESIFERITLEARRAMEFAADDAACSMVGARAMEGALRNFYAHQLSWNYFKNKILYCSAEFDLIPEDYLEAFLRVASTSGWRRGFKHAALNPSSRESNRDTHPSPARRVDAVVSRGRRDAGMLPQGEGDLQTDVEYLLGLAPELTKKMYSTVPERVASTKWLMLVGHIQRAPNIHLLQCAVEACLGPDSSQLLASVLHLLENDISRTQLLQQIAMASPSPTAGRGMAAQCLSNAIRTLVDQSLLESGAARWSFTWGGLVTTIHEGDTEWTPLIEAAVAGPAGVGALRRQLGGMGFDFDRAELVLPIRARGSSARTERAADDSRWGMLGKMIGSAILLASAVILFRSGQMAMPVFLVVSGLGMARRASKKKGCPL